MIDKFCGRAIIPTVHSSSNTLWFRYVVAESHRGQGVAYELYYTSTDQGMGCGGTLYNTRGVVTSPNYPRAFTQSSNCEWRLKVPPGEKIELRFTGTYIFFEEVSVFTSSYREYLKKVHHKKPQEKLIGPPMCLIGFFRLCIAAGAGPTCVF